MDQMWLILSTISVITLMAVLLFPNVMNGIFFLFLALMCISIAFIVSLLTLPFMFIVGIVIFFKLLIINLKRGK